MKELCKLARIKQVNLAREIGVAQSVVSDWQNDKTFPSAENLITLSRILGVSTDCILGLKPIPEGYPDLYIEPVFYSEVVANQAKAAEEGRLYKPKKAPFTQAQIEYLDERDNQLVVKITTALREDSFLLRENQKEAE